MKNRSTAISIATSFACVALMGASAGAQTVLFSDTFDSGPSPMWGNQFGNWRASGGEYFADAPTNQPPTYSLLPFVLSDFTIETDVRAVSDGGVWLRVDATTRNGVLLVTGGSLRTGRGLYWHVIHDGSYSPPLNASPVEFAQGDNIHLRVTVRGNVYAAYLNGRSSPATTLETADFAGGRIGVYDFAAPLQRFDNFVLSTPCAADFNADGFLDPDDLSDFIACYFASPACDRADFNADGNVDPDDLSDYIAAFFGGC